MQGTFKTPSERAQYSAAKPAGLFRHILKEVEVTVLVGTGLVVIFSGYFVDGVRQRIRKIFYPLPTLDFPDPALPRPVVAAANVHGASRKHLPFSRHSARKIGNFDRLGKRTSIRQSAIALPSPIAQQCRGIKLSEAASMNKSRSL